MYGYISFYKKSSARKIFFLAKTLLLLPPTMVWIVVSSKSPKKWSWRPFQKVCQNKGPFSRQILTTLKGCKSGSFGLCELKFGMDQWIEPYFWEFEKFLKSGFFLLNKYPAACQIFGSIFRTSPIPLNDSWAYHLKGIKVKCNISKISLWLCCLELEIAKNWKKNEKRHFLNRDK